MTDDKHKVPDPSRAAITTQLDGSSMADRSHGVTTNLSNSSHLASPNPCTRDPTGMINPAFVMDEVGDHETNKTGEAGEAPHCVLSREEKTEKLAIMKNVIIISVAFTFLFTSFNALSNLESSINKTMGTTAYSTIYIAIVISCCFVPSWLLQKLKEKYSMVVAMACYSTFMAAHYYSRLYTLVPTAIILGFGAAPLWAAKCTYLTKVGKRYAELVGEDTEVVITRFFGIFFFFFQSTQVWGNLVSSTVLSIGVEENVEVDEEALLSCGYNFCIAEPSVPAVITNASNNVVASAEQDGPPLWKIYIIATIFLCCSILAALITFFFVDPVTRFKEAGLGECTSKPSVYQLLAATLNHVRHPYQMLLIPLTMWSGFEMQFLFSDYTAAYVTCSLEMHMVGYVIICFGVCDAFFSVALTQLVKMVGRVPVFTLGLVINLVLIIACIYWRPHPDDRPWFYVVAALWGVGDAIWQTQINGRLMQVRHGFY
ncbi:UNC93-like protein isoform X2 [Panulirus ornatus]|uniref:UNC93-like protein isoform X2 n=1 Tax=Panulirus ornatus TaxID=150431 RepID=UPI003A856E6C